MTQAETIEVIRQEILSKEEEARKLRINGTTQQAKEADAVIRNLLAIKSFINALEEPLCEDIEKEMERYYDCDYYTTTEGVSWMAFRSIAIHFSSWKREKDQLRP